MLHRHRVKSVRAAAAKLKTAAADGRSVVCDAWWGIGLQGHPGRPAGGRAGGRPLDRQSLISQLVVHVIARHVVHNTVIYLSRRIRADRYIQSSDRITRSNIIHM